MWRPAAVRLRLGPKGISKGGEQRSGGTFERLKHQVQTAPVHCPRSYRETPRKPNDQRSKWLRSMLGTKAERMAIVATMATLAPIVRALPIVDQNPVDFSEGSTMLAHYGSSIVRMRGQPGSKPGAGIIDSKT